VCRISDGGLLRVFLTIWLTQGADEKHQLPAVVRILVVPLGPAWHSRDANAVTNDIADLAVGKKLGFRRKQIWRFGVEVATNGGSTRAIGSVANGAASDETFARFLQDFGSGLRRIHFVTGVSRDGEVAGSAIRNSLKERWLYGRAEAARNQASRVETAATIARPRSRKRRVLEFIPKQSPIGETAAGLREHIIPI
jgi:hypothetical protein